MPIIFIPPLLPVAIVRNINSKAFHMRLFVVELTAATHMKEGL
jgi:hypothetical protein